MLFHLLIIALLITTRQVISSPICHAIEQSTPNALNVSVKFIFNSFEGFDDVKGILSVIGTVVLIWQDQCVWKVVQEEYPERSKYNSPLPLKSAVVWKPLIVQTLSTGSMLVGPSSEELPLDIHRDGTVEWWNYGLWETKCFTNLEKFPFDVQQCKFTFDNWLTTDVISISEANWMLATDMMNLALWKYELINASIYQTSTSCGKNKSCSYERIDFPIVLTRHWYPYFFYAIFIPLFCLTFLQLSTFFIPMSKAERTTFSATLFLAFAVMRSEIQSYFPQTSENIIILISSNIFLVLSMIATVYNALILTLKKFNFFGLEKKQYYFVDSLIFVTFLLFYFITYITTMCKAAISTE